MFKKEKGAFVNKLYNELIHLKTKFIAITTFLSFQFIVDDDV